MTDDRFWRIVVVAAFFAVLGLFRPKIMRWWRTLGYRDEREVNSTSWKRGAIILGGIVGALAILLIAGSLIK